jgi:cbb3-type cytochrome c oxidase subunit I
LHTNAVIFAFGGCALIATSYYVVQRTCQTRLFAAPLACFTFWGWQLVILAGVITLPLGYTSGKEYDELEWPIDLAIAVVWVSYAIVFFGTIVKRRVSHIYVANWFFGSFILTVALLHIVNSAEVPWSWMKSYSAYSGAQDFIPKAADQRAAATYLVYYRHHLRAEEEVVIPQAVAVLTREDWSDVAAAGTAGADPLAVDGIDPRYSELRRALGAAMPER